MDIGKRLRGARQAAGLTQDAVAEELCVTRQTISNWEVGKNLPDIYFVLQLSRLYAISVDTLLLNFIDYKGDQSMKANLSDAQILKLIKRHSIQN